MTFNTQTKNDKLFSLLFDAAQTADLIQSSRHASAIVYKKQVLAVGINSRKTHPLSCRFNGPDKPCLHSELDAIIQVINQHGPEILKRCSLWNLRITKGGKIGSSKPCVGCERAIKAFGIARVYWT